MSGRFVKFAVLAAAIVALSGCSTTADKNCPLGSALIDTSSLTVFRTGATPDPANAIYTIQIAKVDSDCSLHKYDRTVSTDLTLSFTATRASSGSAATYAVPYFVVVTQGDKIVKKRRFNLHFTFDAGENTTTFSETVDSTEFTLAKSKHGYDYALLVGFQLTQAQLDYNRTAGRYPK